MVMYLFEPNFVYRYMISFQTIPRTR